MVLLCFFYSLCFIYHYNAIHVSAVLFNNKATSDSVLMGAFVCCGSVCLQRLHHLWNPLWKEPASFENRRLPWICSSLLFIEPMSTHLLVSSSLSSTDGSGSARENRKGMLFYFAISCHEICRLVGHGKCMPASFCYKYNMVMNRHGCPSVLVMFFCKLRKSQLDLLMTLWFRWIQLKLQ